PVTAHLRTPGVDLYAVGRDGSIVMLPGALGVEPVDAASNAWVPVGTGGPGFAAQAVAVVASDATTVHVLAMGADGNVWDCDGDGTPGGFSTWSEVAANAPLPWSSAWVT